ncbi:MAG: 3-phosphoshikimate 1-carboxyvinyltransferase [Candidatus Bathyarchaeota archaeon]|nr:3-phosphoshikimate 1-carboxyvinyltransferase [Candidatus Bathyarchaeota archaeon]
MTDVIIRRTLELKGEICAPPSKAYTQRLLIAAALSSGTSKVVNPLLSQDTEATLRVVRAMGAKITFEYDCWTVEGVDSIQGSKQPVDCGESGATLRFAVPIAALAARPTIFVMRESLAKRPIAPLLQSLEKLGVKARLQSVDGNPAVRVEGGGIQGGATDMPGDVSSQFVSGLMFACPLAKKDTTLDLTTPLESKTYVQMTQAVLAQHGIKVEISPDFMHFKIPANQKYYPNDSQVPGDFSSAAFILAAAAITKSDVTLKNLNLEAVQGDKLILEILRQMGVESKICSDQVKITGNGNLLKAIDIDARDIPDLIPVCSVLGCFAKGASKIYNAKRLRFKESDRLESIYVELKNMGAHIDIDQNSLTIKGPSSLYGVSIDPFNDHRIAMSCAVAALRAEGETVIQNAECVRKSYPHFFGDLHKLGADIVGWEFDR